MGWSLFLPAAELMLRGFVANMDLDNADLVEGAKRKSFPEFLPFRNESLLALDKVSFDNSIYFFGTEYGSNFVLEKLNLVLMPDRFFNMNF